MNWRRILCILLFVSAACNSARAQAPQKLTLQEAETMALKNHPQIQYNQFNALAAKQATVEEKSAYYPYAFGSLTGAGAERNSRIAAGGLNNPIILNRESNGFTVGQLITDFGRTQNLVASSRLHAQAAQEDVQTARQDVLLQVDRAYYGVLKAQAVLKVAQQTVKDRQLVSDQVTELEKSKLKSGLDVSFADVNLEEAKLLLVQAQNDEQATIAALSTALGFADQRTFDLQDVTLPSAPLAPLAEMVNRAFQNRPELISLRYDEESSQRFARAERDLVFPTISALATAGETPVHQVALGDNYAAAGVNVNIPIFNGHLFAARRAEAEFKANAEDQRLRDLQNRVARDVRVAWLNANTAFQRLGLTARLLKEASLALDLSQSRYKLGLSSIVELSQAQLNQTQALIEQTSAKYDYEYRLAALDYQVGLIH